MPLSYERLKFLPVRKTNNAIFCFCSKIAVGVLLMVCLFAVTWILGIFAFIKFPGSGIPNFYPIFQVGKLSKKLSSVTSH
jgi:hypothetical protein